MLALKLFLVPVLLALITLAGRRWGPAIAGWLAGFPVLAGPILLLIALEQGAPFAVSAAGGSLLSVPAILCFCLAYAWAAIRLPWWLSLPLGLACYVATAAALMAAALPNAAVFVLTLVALALALVLPAFPRNGRFHPVRPPSPAELPLRMLAAALLVLMITFFASHLGPRLSGLLSTVPLLSSLLAVFTHALSGPGAAIGLLRGMVIGFYALSTFAFALAFTLPTWGTAGGFLAALACAMLVHLATLLPRSAALKEEQSLGAE